MTFTSTGQKKLGVDVNDRIKLDSNICRVDKFSPLVTGASRRDRLSNQLDLNICRVDKVSSVVAGANGRDRSRNQLE